MKHSTRSVALYLFIAFTLGCGAAHDGAAAMRREVVLYRNGVAYIARESHAEGGRLRLRVRAGEIDDVLSTLTIQDARGRGERRAPAATIPSDVPDDPMAIVPLDVDLGSDRTVHVAYATHAASWRTSYRIVLPETRGPGRALLQGWAVVDNPTAEDWRDVRLTLATDSPFTFAVDLRTPRTVARPDATLAVSPEGSVEIPSFTRSQVTPDRDADGILDLDDQCPADVESYNGTEDDDGCPDHGMVVIQDSNLVILERVLFPHGSARIPAEASAILDATAAAILGAESDFRVEVQGHAHEGEPSPYALAAERAAAVRGALEQRGVPRARLDTRSFGSARALMGGDGARARELARRVDFLLLRGSEENARNGVRADALEATVGRPSSAVVDASGARYRIGRPITIRAGSSSMIAMLDVRLPAEAILLFDAVREPSAREARPHRAVRISNEGGSALVPGPVALYGEGEMVGQGLLDALPEGENAFVPYGVDPTTRVSSDILATDRPGRLRSIERGIARVERILVRTTRYEVQAGGHAPARLFVRHPVASDFSIASAPPGHERGDAVELVPIPLERRQTSAVEIVEERTIEVQVDLARDVGVDLAPYLEATDLAPADRAALDAVLADRASLAGAGDRAAELHTRLDEATERIAELRDSVASLAGTGGGAADTRRRLARRLETAVADAEALGAELATLRAEEADARASLRAAAEQISFRGR